MRFDLQDLVDSLSGWCRTVQSDLLRLAVLNGRVRVEGTQRQAGPAPGSVGTEISQP